MEDNHFARLQKQATGRLASTIKLRHHHQVSWLHFSRQTSSKSANLANTLMKETLTWRISFHSNNHASSPAQCEFFFREWDIWFEGQWRSLDIQENRFRRRQSSKSSLETGLIKQSSNPDSMKSCFWAVPYIKSHNGKRNPTALAVTAMMGGQWTWERRSEFCSRQVAKRRLILFMAVLPSIT